MIEFPLRESLARTPTPLERLDRVSDRLGVDLWIKRDDLTGSALSGNKVRKLEFHLAEMRRIGADTIVTCGGIQSNHCRATAAAARRAGFEAVLLLRGDSPSAAEDVQANLLLDHLLGARIRFVGAGDYAERLEEIRDEILARLRSEGRRPYWTPSGGSDAVGAWGYVAAMRELAEQFDSRGIREAVVVHAVGSGGTGAGLILGRKLLGLDRIRIVGVNVCDTAEEFRRIVPSIANACSDRYGLGIRVEPSDVDVRDGYVGRGYALSRPEEIRAIAELAREEGIVLDPVYTGKAFFGLLGELAKDPRTFGARIVFLHTGGLYGFFAKPADVIESIGPLRGI